MKFIFFRFFLYKQNLNFGGSFHSLNLRIKQSLPLIPGALPLKSGGAPETRGTRFPHIVKRCKMTNGVKFLDKARCGAGGAKFYRAQYWRPKYQNSLTKST